MWMTWSGYSALHAHARSGFIFFALDWREKSLSRHTRMILIKRSFTHKAPQIWNTLPTNIRESDSSSSFKKCLKTHLFAGYC